MESNFEVSNGSIEKLVEKIQAKPKLPSFHVQGVRTQKFMFQFALTDRNIQARFGLRVVGES